MAQAPTDTFAEAQYLNLKPHRGRIEIRFQIPEGKLLMVSIPARQLLTIADDIKRTRLPATEAEIKKHDEA